MVLGLVNSDIGKGIDDVFSFAKIGVSRGSGPSVTWMNVLGSSSSSLVGRMSFQGMG